MKQVFQKSDFPKALGGNLYDFKEAITSFEVEKTGFYIVKITASSKNAKQNKSTDDDDLRVILDGYSFGKYFMNKGKLTWKGFNTASAWSGAKLQGKSKTVNFFVYLNHGKHTLNFIADNTPMIQSLDVFEIQPKQKLQIETNTQYTSLVFLGVKPQLLEIGKRENQPVEINFNEESFKVEK